MSSPISPTAHYTGQVWVRNGLSHPGLSTLEGRAMFESLRVPMMVSRLLGGPTLESYLLARHRAIDRLLTEAIDRGGISQVIEVAAGLSPRGWRFSRRYGSRLTYVEADLPDMAERKRHALQRIGAPDHLRVEAIDALKPDGEGSLAELADSLDRSAGLAIVTEGLLGYLPSEEVTALWQRFATVLAGFQGGRYLSDLHLAGKQTAYVRGFRLFLSGFVRGRVYLHFATAGEAEAALREAGFAGAKVRAAAAVLEEGQGAGARLAHIIEASTR
jgi:O-methyltransferase involved in polyketide biosynthesis